MNGVVYEDGEVGEHTRQYGGGGPDSNYSYTGWAYVYLYRLLCGNNAMDHRLLQAMLENGLEPRAAPLPAWYANHLQLYDRPDVQYALVSRAYQTGVVFRGRLQEGYYSPLRGIQSFAFGDEYPILLHTDTAREARSPAGGS